MMVQDILVKHPLNIEKTGKQNVVGFEFQVKMISIYQFFDLYFLLFQIL